MSERGAFCHTHGTRCTKEDHEAASIRIGERRIGYTMDPLDINGHAVNHGMGYGNADEIEGARAWARLLVNATTGGVWHVSITGSEFEWRGGWHHVRVIHSEVIHRTAPLPVLNSPADQRARCGFSDAADQDVHEQRSNGSCRCGKVPAGTPTRFDARLF